MSKLSVYFRHGLDPATIGFVEQTMQDYIVFLDCHTETTLIMETTVPTTAPDSFIEDNTTELNPSLLL
jgi:hypothetical protein